MAAVHRIIAAKDRKRGSALWRTFDSTILVIELQDYTFESLCAFDDRSLATDCANTGFIEIWIADYFTLAAYGEVRLIGLYPEKI
jgi:hypothetical protein